MVSKHWRNVDVLLAGIATILAFTLSTLELPFRALLYVPVVSFAPGYSFLAVLQPYRTYYLWKGEHPAGAAINRLEYAALSVLTSIPITTLTAYAVVIGFGQPLSGSFPWLALMGLTVTFGAIASWRRREISIRAAVGIMPPPRSIRRSETISWIAAIICAAILTATIAMPRASQEFTEFYLLPPAEYNADGIATVEARHNLSLVLGIHNREGEAHQYSIVIIGSALNTETPSNSSIVYDTEILLEDRERREWPVAISFQEIGVHQLDVHLKIEGGVIPYRSLRISVNVVTAAGEAG